MDDNPYKSPESKHEPQLRTNYPKWWPLASLAAFVVGLPCGFIAVVTGSAHGPSILWPSAIFSAPVYIPSRLVFGGELGFAYSIVAGTGLLYAIYMYILLNQPASRAFLLVIAIHVFSILVMLVSGL
ncbi:MAG: hypothetical protein SGJ19_07305 [Planctomycetia bacterium]|nr:hypothetical protein [Planctomycetia bacterium]